MRVPAPQFSLQAAKVVDNVQSAGSNEDAAPVGLQRHTHAAVDEHACEFAGAATPAQVPAWPSWFMHMTWRVCTPAPQVLLQVDHAGTSEQRRRVLTSAPVAAQYHCSTQPVPVHARVVAGLLGALGVQNESDSVVASESPKQPTARVCWPEPHVAEHVPNAPSLSHNTAAVLLPPVA